MSDEEVHDEEPWLVSYADLMTLLFGFFVIMYSFAQAKIDRMPVEALDENYILMRKEMSKYFGSEDIDPLKKVEDKLKEMLKDADAAGMVNIKTYPEGMEISLQSKAVFPSGSAQLKPRIRSVLKVLAKGVLEDETEYKVVVEGHTDDIPIKNSKVYPSNWELSSARASAVVRLMEGEGFKARRLQAIGYGAAKPLVDNRDENGNPIAENTARNRRVKVKVMKVSDFVLEAEKQAKPKG